MGLYDVVNMGTSAFSSTQITAIETALTDAVGSLVDTFVSLLPVIALICGALFGVRFITRLFKRVD